MVKEYRKLKSHIDLTNIPKRDDRNLLIYIDGNKHDDRSFKPLTISQLARKYGVSYPTAKKWKECEGNNKRKKRIRRNTKMTKKMKDYIIKQAGNKMTLIGKASPNIIARKLIKKFGEEYSTEEKKFKISNTCVRNHMTKILTKARKLKKSFKTTKENINNRHTFCETLVNNGYLDSHSFFFIDEKIFELEKGAHRGTNWIRLTKESKQKLNRGDNEIEKLISNDVPKKSKSFMVAGGISIHGPGKLIFISGNQDSKAYIKSLNYFKEDINYINEKHKCNLIFQQDNAPTHRSSESKKVIRDLFYEQPDIKEELEVQKPPKFTLKKTKDMTQATYEEAKRMNTVLAAKYDKAQNDIKSKFKVKNQVLDLMIEKWPANSPVIFN